MNIVTATARLLRSVPAVTGLARVDKWELAEDVMGQGTVAVVIQSFGSWHSESVSSARFPRLYVLIHADVTRNSTLQKTANDANDRAMDAWDQVDKVLHVTSHEVQYWGGDATTGLRVLGSERASEPQYVIRPGTLETSLLRAVYNVKVG